MLRRIRPTSWAIFALALIFAIVVQSNGVGVALDRVLEPLRFAVHRHDASGKVAIVEMDAASAAAIKRWPWPRRNYVAVVDRLRRAGAASIVFDVEFSASSNPVDDGLFAAALARTPGLVALPTFGQQASASDVRSIDALPLPQFREHSTLASVSVAPDDDGIVRDIPFATITAGIPRPSLAAYIAQRPGRADTYFPIDMSIRQSSIPRLSFVAIRDGRFDPAQVRGRNILIGATAIEMGDRYAAPVGGVQPGVVFQALAAETLLDGVPWRGSWLVPALIAALLSTAVLACRKTRTVLTATGIAIVVVVALVLAAQLLLLASYPLIPALAVLAAAGGMGIARCIAERFQHERSIDEPTGLPNRRAWFGRDGADHGYLALVQINNLDMISAVLGTDQINIAIVRTAERIGLASADGRVFRVRGHHLAFAIAADAPVEDSIAALRVLLLQPVEVAGRRVDVSISIGIARTGDRDRRLTDAALAAEEARRAGVFWHQGDVDIDAMERSISLMGELDGAMAAGQISVVYQPKLAVKSGRISSVEALVRWQHPVRGFIGPDLFIPMAEQTDRIEALTLYVLDRVIEDLAAWRAIGHAVDAAVNISAKLLSAASFNVAIEQRLTQATVPNQALIFEVTESAAMSEPVTAIAALRRYRELGVSVSMDDYGTGQSTLTYLRRLPLNELKIDRSFVQFAHRNDEDAVLVRSTVELAHQLGLKVVAEGVEDQECLAFLGDLGCDLIQGYVVSRPLGYGSLIAFLGERHALAA